MNRGPRPGRRRARCRVTGDCPLSTCPIFFILSYRPIHRQAPPRFWIFPPIAAKPSPSTSLGYRLPRRVSPPPHRAPPRPAPPLRPPTWIDGFKSETLARISLYTRKGRAGTMDFTIHSATASVHGNQCKYPPGVLCSACSSADTRHICIYIANLRPPRGRRYACPRPICNSSSLAFPPSP